MHLWLVTLLLVANSFADRIPPRINTSWKKQNEYYIQDTFTYLAERNFDQHSQIAIGCLIYAEETVSDREIYSNESDHLEIAYRSQEDYERLKEYVKTQFYNSHFNEDRHIQIFDDAIIQLDFIVKNRIYSEKYQVIEDIWSMIQNLHRFSSLNSLVINFNEVKNSFGEFIYSEIKNLCSKVCLSKDKICEESQISKVVFHMIISK